MCPEGTKVCSGDRNKQFSDTTEEAAEKTEKQIPRELKPARNHKNKGLSGTAKAVP